MGVSVLMVLTHSLVNAVIYTLEILVMYQCKLMTIVIQILAKMVELVSTVVMTFHASVHHSSQDQPVQWQLSAVGQARVKMEAHV